MVLLANAGLLFAPAAYAGALFPGVMPPMVRHWRRRFCERGIYVPKGDWVRPDHYGRDRHHLERGGHRRHHPDIGNLLLLCAGWPGPATPSRCGAHGWTASTPPLSRLPPVWRSICRSTRISPEPTSSGLPWPIIALQAVVQGFLTGIVALFLYGRMVSILGATSGAAFLALTPAMTALMGISILGEFPSAIDWLMIVVISIGIYTVSGGPLSGPNAARAESMRQPICRTSSGASRPTGRDRATEDVVARGD